MRPTKLPLTSCSRLSALSCVLVTAIAVAEVPLAAISLDADFNYALTGDADDPSQLTDGRLTPFPFWTRRTATNLPEKIVDAELIHDLEYFSREKKPLLGSF